MFYFDKLHCLEKGNLVFAKSIYSSMEHSHRIITSNEFKTLYKLATAFQVNTADCLVLSFKYVCGTVSGCTKAPCQGNLSLMLLLKLFLNLFMFVNSLGTYVCSKRL